jgi:putative ATP-binding cassette transporter
VVALLLALDRLEDAEQGKADRVRHRACSEGLHLRALDVTAADGGTRLVSHVETSLTAGERVLLVGDSGTGKSALVRALGGCWPWGQGQVIRTGQISVIPQRPYVPAGSLRAAVCYPKPPEAFELNEVREALAAVGLATFLPRLDDEWIWDQTLSTGEKQRLAFARLLLHRPGVIVLDEATSALDVRAQARVMDALTDRLPDAVLLSIGHRPELERFHHRKLTMLRQPEGARIVADEPIGRAARTSANAEDRTQPGPAQERRLRA